jgi:nitrogen fixation NifU-like protein
MYSPQLLDHFEHPRNAGDVAHANARMRVENPACGDILELAVRVEAGRIREIRFLAKGCVPAMACGSLITEMVAAGCRQLRDMRRNWQSTR